MSAKKRVDLSLPKSWECIYCGEQAVMSTQDAGRSGWNWFSLGGPRIEACPKCSDARASEIADEVRRRNLKAMEG